MPLKSQRPLLAHPNEEIADVLLHQEVLAGVGNVFKSEICFVTGIIPFCKVATLTHSEARPQDRQLPGKN
jgi:endonuclease-8